MLGDNLLIASVLEENVKEITIYFPQGTWKCIDNEQIYEGNQSYSYPVTIEDIPVFERYPQ